MQRSMVLKSAMKAVLPFQVQLRRIKRRMWPYQDNPDNSRHALRQGLEQIRLLKEAGIRLDGTVLEFGSGWLPIIPLLFHLSGARHLILTDLERLMDDQTITRARQVILDNLPAVGATLDLDESALMARLAGPFEPDYFVPWDSRAQPSQSVDIIVSRAVLEHVPSAALRHVLPDFDRILRPGGAMCHIIDNSDHWEHKDKTLSRVNFLRYEDGLFWKLACLNTQAYQNRLRHSDYSDLFEAYGWTVAAAEGTPDEKCLRDLETLPLASSFRDRDPRDLAILTSGFVLRRTADLTRGAPA